MHTAKNIDIFMIERHSMLSSFLGFLF